MDSQEIVGLGPRAGLWVAMTGIPQLRLGRLSYRGLSDRVDMGRIRSTRILYMGYAVKQRRTGHASR